MPTFKAYCPYSLDLELINKSRLHLMDQQKRILGEPPFLELLREILGWNDGYEVENRIFTSPALVVRSRGEELRVEPKDSDENFLLLLLELCLDVGKEGWISQWVWYFIEDDRVIEDASTTFYRFFVCEGDKILRDRVVLYNLPDDLLKEKQDFFFFTDREYQMAETRLRYEDFFKNSRCGQLFMSSRKNRRDIDIFGSIDPCVDEFPLAVVPTRIDIILKELKYLRWTLVAAFIVIVVILFFKS